LLCNQNVLLQHMQGQKLEPYTIHATDFGLHLYLKCFLFLGDFVFLQIGHVYLFSFVSSLCLNGFSFAWIIEYSDTRKFLLGNLIL